MTADHNRRFWEWAFISVTAFWGWSFSAIHAALNSLSDSSFNTWRFFFASISILPIVLRRSTHFTKKEVGWGMTTGMALFLAFLFQTKGLNYTTASNASFITGLTVVITPLLSWLFLKMEIMPKQILGAIIAAIGLALLTLTELNIRRGDTLVLICALFFSIHVILLSKASKLSDAVNLTFTQLATVSTLSALQALFSNELAFPDTNTLIHSVLPIAIIGTALGFFVQTNAQIASSPNKIALIIVLEPVFGGLFGYLLAGDRLSMQNWLGAALIIVAMLITELQFGTRKTAVSLKP
ncbi:DMT family transporter [Vogesella sp. LIG4]|uniref:DMT family transporter n=1 Tax=Vogesella sp. LIG4 TaxID=1192162 RepID=UPI0008201BB7|nr:DMT family transporter [Vogesella sp. LIG4]SCK12863.1 Permease of the drug/metabolite transporter (DMT) superfamily [Vogesella sp. LIG4]